MAHRIQYVYIQRAEHADLTPLCTRCVAVRSIVNGNKFYLWFPKKNFVRTLVSGQNRTSSNWPEEVLLLDMFSSFLQV